MAMLTCNGCGRRIYAAPAADVTCPWCSEPHPVGHRDTYSPWEAEWHNIIWRDELADAIADYVVELRRHTLRGWLVSALARLSWQRVTRSIGGCNDYRVPTRW